MKNNILIVLLIAAVCLICGFLLGRKFNPAGSSVNDINFQNAGSKEGEAIDMNSVCEHNLRIIECNICRYEAGVVKVAPAVAKSLLETGSVTDSGRSITLKLTGEVQLDSTRTVDVVAAGGGRVELIKKLLGEKVEKGDILAVIHSADLGQAKADFLEVQAKLELAQATFKREKELYEKKITSQADYLDALNELKTAEASYAAADKRLRLFGLQTEQIAGIRDEKDSEEFANLILRAPQEGSIITQNISVGKIVQTTDSLYTISDISNLWVWCDVYEKDLALLNEQFIKSKTIPAVVRIKAFEPDVFQGVVDFIGNVMDQHTRTVKLRVQLSNPDNKLRPGMFADVEVVILTPERMLAVPRTALLSDSGKNFVFQQLENDLWIRRDVVIGDKYGNLVEIRSGIPEGAVIVTGGAFMLKSDILREKMGAGCAE